MALTKLSVGVVVVEKTTSMLYKSSTPPPTNKKNYPRLMSRFIYLEANGIFCKGQLLQRIHRLI